MTASTGSSARPNGSVVCPQGGRWSGCGLWRGRSLRSRRASRHLTVDNLNDAGPGSLREAVANANAIGVADQIVFQSGLSGQITLATGDIDIYGPVDIQGPGADQVTVSGNDLYRIFDIDTFNAGDQVSISGLTLSHGYNNGDGGALRAIASRLTLTDMVLEDSRATEQGGGVFTSEVALKLIDSVLTGNSADGSGDYGGGGAYIASSYPDGSPASRSRFAAV